ncbi:BppU family phage baseplate upper protein [Limosilactobacillus reuteri]|uniref:BppU family phage baseplate upper protein n=1 Tax=Limosilactobacillus reuteri TaxID=1598 RepID=UPI003F2451A0
MSQTLTYVMGADNRALVDNVQDFHIDWNEQRNDNWITARQWEDGMRQVFVNIKNQDGTPFDLTGCNVWFEGFLPKSAKGDFRVIDDEGYVPIDESAGKFRFDMPKQAFPLAGSYRQAFFRILKNGNSVTTLEFDLKVLADKVVTGLVPRDWTSPFERIVDELMQSFKDHTAQADKVLNDFQNKVTDLINELNRQGSATTSMLNGIQNRIAELEDKIKRDDLVTKPQLDEFEKHINELIENNSASSAYNTVADMQHDNKLKVGNMAHTFGYYSPNDGGGADYRIMDHPDGFSIELDNHLWAQQINYTDNNYYDEIGYSIDRDHNYHTTCYTVTIPKFDKHGNMIMPEMNYHQNWISSNAWARQYHTTLTLNGDASIRIGPGETYMNGNIISGGKIIHQADASKQYPNRMKSLAIMNDRSIREYQAGTSAQQMLNDGAQVAFTVYYPLVKNGQKSGYANSDNDQTDNLRAGGRVTEHYPALGLGERPDGTWIVIGCDGRSMVDDGLTADQLAQKFIDAGCTNAWRMDGGGSTSINVRESKINKNMDDNGATDRNLQWTFDIHKNTAADNANSLAMSKIGEEKQNLYRAIMYDIKTFYESDTAILGYRKLNSEDELNSFIYELSSRLNESQYVNGAKLTGILTVKYWGSSIAKALGTDNGSMDFAYVYTCTGGNHLNGKLVITSLTDPRITCWKQFANGQNPKWSQWMMDGLSEEVSVNANGSVKNLHVTQSGNQVQIDCEVNVANNTWTDYITGLPLPGFDNQKFAVWGDGQNKQGFATVSRGGKLTMRADTNDNYPVHYVYLTTGKKDYKVKY